MIRELSTAWGRAGAIWGVGGVMGLVIHGLQRLVPRCLEAFEVGLEPIHWLFVAAWVPLLAWSEGYRGFHGQFSPMVAARARYLRDHPRPLHVALAPLFCLGLLHATRRRWVRSFTLTTGIVLLVILVRLLEQPWRGAVDLGVVVGLSLGLASMSNFAVEGLSRERFDHDPEVPGGV